MYKFKENINAKEHDTFIKSHPLCNLLQSSSWAKVKDNWKSRIVGVYDDNKIIASSSILIKPLPLGFSMIYIPRGPIMDYENKRLVAFYFQELYKWAKQYKCLFIKIDPAIHYKNYLIGEEAEVNANISQIMDTLNKCGLQHQGFLRDFDATIQPRFHANVYQNDFGEEMLSKSCKKMLKIAMKKQVEVKMCGKEKLREFAQLMDCTSSRKGIALRSYEYYEALLSIYGDNAFIMLAKLNLKDIYDDTFKRYQANLLELESCPENAKKKKFTLEELDTSLSREVETLKQSLEKEGNEVYIAGTLSIVFGDTSEVLYAGMNEEYKRYMAPYLTWLETIRECFKQEAKSSNLGGVEGTMDGGLAKFKANYHPHIDEYIGEFNMPLSRLYQLSQIAYKIRKKKSK